jgi:hypothetical protein
MSWVDLVRNSADSSQEEREISTWVDLLTSCTLLGEEQCGQWTRGKGNLYLG